MIVGETDGHQESGFDLAVPNCRLKGATSQPEDCDFGSINNRGKMRPADATLIGDGKGTALQFLTRKLS